MSRPIIEVRNLAKRYQLGAIGATSLREEASRLWDRVRGVPHPDAQEFWALRDVSFDVQPGEVVGVIGRNGAGKSTLLKILSRITEPTSGHAKLRGRVASLLEVGTGFHPELTGRENVYLNGAILGMSRAEVRKKFDEIVAFAEIEKFIDTPVKRYSSGMYVRLAFAVAAHLEPEILIVDEVLAVGDIQFQKKCLGKMTDVASHGRTIVFVSHNMTAVTALCQKGILMQDGRVNMMGPIADVAKQYLDAGMHAMRAARAQGQTIISSARLLEVSANGKSGQWVIGFEIALSDFGRLENIGIDFILRHNETAFAFGGSAYFAPISINKQVTRVRCDLGPINLALGSYEIDLRICDPMKTWLEEHDSMVQFKIEQQVGSERLFHLDATRNLGFVIPAQYWSVVETKP
jgi:lipopolysaccharide transport system ATP-binding protein